MAIDLNVVKSINKNGSEITQLKSGDTVIWKKMSVSITETPITGGKTISFSKTSGDPLQHTFHTRIKATDSYSTSKTSYDVKTVTSGTASGIVAGATITAANTVASKEQAWSVTRATASIAVNTVSQGKTITITNTSGSGTLHYLFSGSTWLTTSDTSITSDPYTSATSGNTAKAYVTGASGFADADTSTATTQGWSVTKATAPTITPNDYLENGIGGKTFTITNNMTGTGKGQLQYKIGASGTWTNISDGGTTPPVTSAAVIYAQVINVTGYANSDSSTDSVTQLAVPTLNSAANYPDMSTANQRTHRIDAPSGSTLYVHWTNGTPTSAGASYSTKVANASNTSGTAKAYAVKSGYANSETVSLAWSITKASIKTISVTNITSGKKAIASSDYTGTIKMDTSTPPTTSRSEIPFTTVTNTNVYAKIINVGGYLDSNVYGPTAVEVTRVAAPTVSTPDNNNGGKNFAFSYPSGINTGTFNYTTSFTSDILTGSSSPNYCASTTTQTCNVWLTGVSGYADATSSANNKTGSFTLTLASAPSLTSENITSGKKMALTNNAATGTLQYQKSSNGSSSWSNYADNDTVRKTLTATRFYGQVINVKGYANNTSSPAYIQVDYLVPTVEAETITGNAGKRIKYSGNSAGGTLHYVAGAPLNLNSTTTDASKTTSYWTSADAVTYNAWITGSIGYADGSNSAGNKSGSFTLNYNQNITITFPSNANGGRNVSVTKGSAAGTLHYTVSGGLTVTEKTTTATTAQTTTNWTNTTATICNAWITGTPGYADATSTAGNVSNSTQLEAAAKPTAGAATNYLNSNTTEGGKSVTFTNNATGGTLQVSKDNSNWSNGATLYYTTVVTGVTAYGRVINVPDKANSANATQTVTTKQIKVPVWGTAQSTSNKKYVDATIYNTTTDGTALGGYPSWTISGASGSESVNDTTKRANLTAVGDYTPSIKVYKSGFVSNSATVSSTISVVQASNPTIAYNEAITSGRKYKITNNESSGNLYYKIGANGTATAIANNGTVDVTGNNTIYAWVTNVSGETTSGNASATVPVVAAPNVVPTAYTSRPGGKYFALSYGHSNDGNGGAATGTINFSVTGGFTQTGTGTSTNSYAGGTTETVCTAWVTGAKGWADASSSVNKGTGNFTLKKIAQPASPSESNIANGKKLTYTAPTKDTVGTNLTETATIYITSSDTNPAPAISSNEISWTERASGSCTAYAWAKNYAYSATRDGSVEISQATKPTINYNSSTGAISNGRRYTITNNETGTLQYKIGSGNWTNYSSAVDVTGNTTIYARVTDVSGKYTSTSDSKTVPILATPEVYTSDNITPTSSNGWVGGKYVSFEEVKTASDGSTGLTTTMTVGGGTGTGTRTVNMTTAGSYQPWAQVSLNGYATSVKYTVPTAINVYKLDTPTISDGNDGIAIRNGKYTIFNWSGKSRNANNTVVETDLTATWLLWGGTSYVRDVGTASSSSTGEVYVQGVVTKQPYAKVCKAGYETSAIKYGTNLQITACTTTKPVISATPISGGKTLSITIPAGTYLCYNWDGDPAPGATDTATAPSVDKTTVTSGTAKAYAYKVGYANVWADNLAWAVTKLSIPELKLATPTNASRTYTLKSQGTDEAGNSGITGCTLSYNWNGTTLNSTATDSIDKTITTVTSGNAYAKVSKNGYVASDTAGPLAWGMEQVGTIADPTSADIDNGKKLTYSAPANCSISVTSVTNGTKSGAVATFTNVASGSATATATRPGYVSRSRTDNVSVPQATDPTISHNDNIYNGTTITITAASGSNTNTAGNAVTLEYKLDSGNWQTYSSAFQQTGAHTIYVRVKDVSGKYPSPGTTSYTISQLAKPTIGYTVSGQTRTYQISSAANTILVYKWNSTDANYTTSENNLSTTKLLNTETSGTAYAYARRKGYADSAEAQDLTWGLSKLSTPSISTNDGSYDKLVITFTRNNTHGTLRYLTSGSTYSSETGDKIVNITSAGSGTARAYVEEAGYITSTAADPKTWSVVQLAQPSMAWSSNAINQRTWTISSEAGSEVCYNWTTNSNFTGAGSNSTTKLLKSTDNPQQSGTAYAYARRKGNGTGSTAYLTSATKNLGTWNLPQLAKPSMVVDTSTANQRVYTVSSSSGSTLYISWINGTPASVSTNTSTQTANASNTGNTVQAYAIQNGYITSPTLTEAWGISKASIKAINPSDITSGKRATATSDYTGTIKMDTSNTVTTARSYIDFNTGPGDWNVYAKITGVAGYLDSDVYGPTAISVSRVAKPTVTTPDNANGGKNFAFSYPSGVNTGTFNYTTSFTSGTLTGSSSTYYCASTATQTCNVWLTGVKGYADATSSANNQTGSFALTAATTPSISDSGITQTTENARIYKVSTTETGTLKYQINSGTWTSITSGNNVTVTGYSTIKAQVLNVSGKANSAVASQTVPQLAAPTISYTVSGQTRTYQISSTTGSTLVYKWKSTDSYTTSSNNLSNTKLLNTETSKTYASAYAKQIGYATSTEVTDLAWELPKLSAPSITTNDSSYDKLVITFARNNTHGTLRYLTSGSSYSSNNGDKTVNITTAGSGTAKAYVEEAGYITSSNATDKAWAVVQLAQPSMSWSSNALNQRTYTISCESGAELCYNWTANSNLTGAGANSTSKTLKSTDNPQQSGHAYAYARRKGNGSGSTAYLTSATKDLGTWNLPQLTVSLTPNMTVANQRTYTASSQSGSTLYINWFNGDPTSTGTNTSTQTATASNTGSTVKAYATQNGYITSATLNTSWGISVAAAPSVAVDNHTNGGKYFKITNNAGGGTINWSVSGGMSPSSGTGTSTGKYCASTAKQTCTAWMTGVGGYLDGSSSSNAGTNNFTLTNATPSLTSEDIAGGKKMALTKASGISGGTLRYHITGGNWADYADNDTVRKVTTATNWYGRVINVPGYADSISNPEYINVSTAFAPIITDSGVTQSTRNARTYKITNNESTGTLNYSANGSTGTVANNGTVTVTGHNTITAYVSGVSGKANSGNATATVPYLTPTITANTDNGGNGGKNFIISGNSASGTINFKLSWESNTRTSTSSSVLTTGYHSAPGTYTCYAWLTNSIGYADGANSAGAGRGEGSFDLTRGTATLTGSTVDPITGRKRYVLTWTNSSSGGTPYMGVNTYRNSDQTAEATSYWALNGEIITYHVENIAGYADSATNTLTASVTSTEITNAATAITTLSSITVGDTTISASSGDMMIS